MALLSFSSDEFAAAAQQGASTLGGGLLMLLQGYPQTILGPFSDLDTFLRPGETWDDFSDIRIFGPAGEWRAFRTSAGTWFARAWLAAQETRLCHPARQILWGVKADPPVDGWVLLREASGASVRVPKDAFQNAENPAALELVEIIDFDEQGLAGVVDVALRSIRPASKVLEEF